MAKPRPSPLLPIFISALILAGVIIWGSGQQPAQVQVISEPSPETATTGQSADGKILLSLSQKPAQDKIFWRLTANQKTIWSETRPAGVEFSLPGNSVSPDNRYLFFQETMPGKTLYWVLSSDGTPLTKDDRAVEFTGLFAPQHSDLKITEATGWAAPNLIIINTDKADASQGPSFWFDLSSQSFIQLTNRFN